MSTVLTLTLTSRLKDIERLATAVDAFGVEHELTDEVMFAVNLSLDEVVTNVISYAFSDAQEHPIVVRLSLDGEVLRAQVTDGGQPFNPLTVPTPDLDAPVEERRIGGLGLHIVREMMDDLEYRREGDKNVLTLTKHLTAVS